MDYRETVTAYIKEDREKGIDVDKLKEEIREVFPLGGMGISTTTGTIYDAYDKENGPHDDRVLRFRANWVKWYGESVNKVDEILDNILESNPDNIVVVHCGDDGQEDWAGDYGLPDIYSDTDVTEFNPDKDPNIFEYDLKYRVVSDIYRNVRVHANTQEDADCVIKKLMGCNGNIKARDIDLAEVAIRTERIERLGGYDVGVEILPHQTETMKTYTHLVLSDAETNETLVRQQYGDVEYLNRFSIDWESIEG